MTMWFSTCFPRAWTSPPLGQGTAPVSPVIERPWKWRPSGQLPFPHPVEHWTQASLGFAGHGAVFVDLAQIVGAGVRLWAPPGAGDQARLQDVQAVKELGEFVGVAQVVGQRCVGVPHRN